MEFMGMFFMLKYDKLNKFNNPKVCVFSKMYVILSCIVIPAVVQLIFYNLVVIFFKLFFFFNDISEALAIIVVSTYFALLAFIFRHVFKHYIQYRNRVKAAKKSIQKFLDNESLKYNIYNYPNSNTITKAEIKELPIDELGLIMRYKFNMLLLGLENENRNQKMLEDLYIDILLS